MKRNFLLFITILFTSQSQSNENNERFESWLYLDLGADGIVISAEGYQGIERMTLTCRNTIEVKVHYSGNFEKNFTSFGLWVDDRLSEHRTFHRGGQSFEANGALKRLHSLLKGKIAVFEYGRYPNHIKSIVPLDGFKEAFQKLAYNCK